MTTRYIFTRLTLIALCLTVFCGVMFSVPARTRAQANKASNPERERALKIYDEGKFT